MKNIFLILLFSLFYFSNAQDTKLYFNLGGDVGFSKVKLNDRSRNLFTNGSFIHAVYDFKYLGIESGVEYFKTQGNIEISGNSEFLENNYLSIPLGFTKNFAMTKTPPEGNPKFTALVAVGVYTNCLMKSHIEGISKETDLGWNFGAYTKFGIHIQASDLLSLGVGMKALQDFSDIERNGISIKLERRNTIYLNFGIHF